MNKDILDSINYIINVESTGSKHNSIITSFSIIKFDINNGEIISKFKGAINPTEQQKYGFRFDWENIINDVFKDKIDTWKSMNFKSIEESLDDISNFLSISSNKEPFYVWGNGPSMNQGKIIKLYNKFDRKIPWDVQNERCSKTIIDLIPNKVKDHIKNDILYEENDNVLNSLYQSRCISYFYSKLKK